MKPPLVKVSHEGMKPSGDPKNAIASASHCRPLIYNVWYRLHGYTEDFGDVLPLLAARAAALLSASSSTVFTDCRTCLASGTKRVISKPLANASSVIVPSFRKDRCPRMASSIFGSRSVLNPFIMAPKMSAIELTASSSSLSAILLSPSASR
mmetsp:Transcript_65634/g.154390  ORF Transcript_65634/g.154390 Transcript_65634/m.154390 type:complete len:152 (-) Transcript_65634:1791-2246(-)